MMWWRRKRDDDLERELRAHLELETDEQRDLGLPLDEAHYAAQRAFGNTTLFREETRTMWGWIALERLGQDLRYALRTMHKSPVFTTAAELSLVLGIGANTAIFTFVNAALLKPLPYPDADRIVAQEQRPLTSPRTTLVHPRSFVPWHDRSRSFEALAIAQAIPMNTQGVDGTAERVPGLWTTPELVPCRRSVADARACLHGPGRIWPRAGPRRSPRRASVVLSHSYWLRRFGADPNMVGKNLPIGRGTAVVISVIPVGFRVGTLNMDVYLLIRIDRSKPEAVGSR
jgi:hypothetical protein